MATLVRLSHPAKAPSSIVAKFAGSETEFNRSQPPKAELPIVIKLEGSEIDSKLVQEPKAPASIVTNPLEKTTLVILVLLAKALIPITETDLPPMLLGIVIAPPLPVYPLIVTADPLSVYPNMVNPLYAVVQPVFPVT
jgi:hypothetical protein